MSNQDFYFQFHQLSTLHTKEWILDSPFLSLSEIEHLAFYQNNLKALNASYYGIVMIKELIHQSYALPKEDIIIYYKGNKPYLKKSSLYISISHSNNIIVVCASLKPIGIDIEYHKERDFKRIADQYFHSTVIDGMENTIDKTAYFYFNWCKIEAFYKLNNALYNPKTIVDKTKVQTLPLSIDPEYTCVVCIKK